MSPEIKELLSNSLTLIIFVLPVVSLFWKLARYSTTMEQQLKQKDERIAALENRLNYFVKKGCFCKFFFSNFNISYSFIYR